MYLSIHCLGVIGGWGMLTNGNMWLTKKDPQMLQMLVCFFLSLIHEIGDESLVVNLKMTFNPSQTFLDHKSTTQKFLDDLTLLGFYNKPKSIN
jgi:hypothetical protein